MVLHDFFLSLSKNGIPLNRLKRNSLGFFIIQFYAMSTTVSSPASVSSNPVTLSTTLAQSGALPNDGHLEISGLLHKKRGGFGKMWPNAWQQRFFTISKYNLRCKYICQLYVDQ